MKQSSTIKKIVSGLTLSVVLVASSVASTYAAQKQPTSPPNGEPQVSGPQSKPPIEPGSKDAKATDKLGNTNQIKTDGSGKPTVGTNLTGSVANVDFTSPYNYCWKNFVYTPVYNSTGSTQYLHILVWNQGMYRDLYTSVAAGSYVYPGFYGVEGSYYAYMYVWSGSYYQYDEYLANNNTCNVSVTRTYDTGGWVQLKIQNTGTAYASQTSSELAPYPGSGTYTGTQYDYPVAGGAAIYRWFYVGYQPYGISSYTYGSWNTPYSFTGDH